MVPRLRHRFHAHHDDALRHRIPRPQRRRHLGRDHPHRMGLRHRQLRLVDRYRPRRYSHLRHPLITAPKLAQFDQPFRRSHDAVRRRLRGHLPRHPCRPPLARLLALSLSQHHGSMAAIPQPAHVGRLRRLHLRHHLRSVLVHRPHPRSRDAARPHRQPNSKDGLRHALVRMARLRPPLASLRDHVSAARRIGHASGPLGSHRRELRFRGRHRPRLAHHHLPALLRRRRHLLRLRHGPDAGHPHPQNLRPRRFHHRRAICRTPPKSCSPPD